MRVAVVFGALTLGACQTTGVTSMTTTAAFQQLPNECAVRPSFPGNDVFVQTSAGPAIRNLTEFRMLTQEDGKSVFRYQCYCRDGYDYGKSSKLDLEGAVSIMASEGQWDGSEHTIKNTGSRKVVDFVGRRADSPFGPAVYDGSIIFEGRCVQTVVGIAPPNDRPRSLRFVSTAFEAGARAAAPAAPQPTTSTVNQRFATLKDLHDRKLITPAEYEAKRKEIIGSL